MKNPILQFFTYDHLPANLREISAAFQQLALFLDELSVPEDHKYAHAINAEVEAALRKLLEAKDCAVRSGVLETKAQEEPNKIVSAILEKMVILGENGEEE